MKRTTINPVALITALLWVLMGTALSACTQNESANALRAELEKYSDAEALIATHLANFDSLDYDVFTHEKWHKLGESPARDMVVHWPDGHATDGIDKHIEDLKAMFVWAPDTRILEHPIRLGQGEWTAVVGFMEGTFTEPMPMPDGTAIRPTGKAYRIRMATIGHWNDEGVMDKEYLFWDNQEFMRQIGLGN